VGATSDSDADFTDDFCRFLQRCVANVDAAELLLTLFKHPERSWHARELSQQLVPIANLSEADVEGCLAAFENCSLVARGADETVRYRPAPAHDSHLVTLARLYIERPVTLFRVIYALRDMKINTFADAFKLRR
jgi:hypothetical protein